MEFEIMTAEQRTEENKNPPSIIRLTGYGLLKALSDASRTRA